MQGPAVKRWVWVWVSPAGRLAVGGRVVGLGWCARGRPESWIPPGHILDLRARVRLRHTLSEQRGEWQQRIQSVLYHHGCPQRGDLINRGGLEWLAAQTLIPLAREQVNVALQMIDAVDQQLAPIDQWLRVYARRQPGCKALTAHYGIGPVTAVTILAELGDPRRFSSSREAVRYAGLDITVHASDQRRAPGRLSRQGPPALRWALFEAAQCARRRTSPDHQYYLEAAEAPRWQPSLPRGRAQTAQAQLSHPARARRGGPHTSMTLWVRAKPFITPMHRGQFPAGSCRHHEVAGLHRQSGRNASPSGITPSSIMSPTRSNPGSWTEIRLQPVDHQQLTQMPDHQQLAQMPGVGAVALGALFAAPQSCGLRRLGEMHPSAERLQFLDHEPPAGRRFQPNL